MKSRILALFTRTPLHVGAGSSVGAIDQPVIRERHTGFPIIPGSSIKGVLRDLFGGESPEANLVFGKAAGDGDEQGESGLLSFSEGRLLLFPLRSGSGSYAMATCPLALRRYARDAGIELTIPEEPDDAHCLSGPSVTINRSGKKGVVLEEYAFESEGEFPADWAEHHSSLLNDAVLKGARNRYVLLSNGDFAHFALNATQVNQHVRIDDKTGTADGGGLFNEEVVPSETLFCSLVTQAASRKDGQSKRLEEVQADLSSESLVQFGGKNTTGLGYCTTKLA